MDRSYIRRPNYCTCSCLVHRAGMTRGSHHSVTGYSEFGVLIRVYPPQHHVGSSPPQHFLFYHFLPFEDLSSPSLPSSHRSRDIFDDNAPSLLAVRFISLSSLHPSTIQGLLESPRLYLTSHAGARTNQANLNHTHTHTQISFHVSTHLIRDLSFQAFTRIAVAQDGAAAAAH